MILIRQNGVKFLFLVALTSLLSCKATHPLNKYGHIVREYYTHYFNDSLKFSYQFAGSYDSEFRKRKIVKALRKNDININSKYCLGYFKSNIGSNYQHFLFYFPSSTDGEITEEPIIDSINYRISQYIPLVDLKGVVLILACYQATNFDKFTEHYKWVFSTVKLGKAYEAKIPQNPFQLALKGYFDEDSIANYVLPIYRLQTMDDNYQKIRDKSFFLQASLTFHSFFENSSIYPKLLNEWNALLNQKNKKKVFYSSTGKNAWSKLIQKCSNQKIVMINEAHFQPEHRLLVQVLLKRLYDQGFRYLALEALEEDQKTLMSRGYPIQHSGFYIREPNFANLVREAIQLGYQVVGYDARSKDRESDQAKNLFERTLQQDSAAKVLVLAGFGHINESPERGERMAVEFKKLTGIDPFTIDQTIFYDIKGKYPLAIVDTVKSDHYKKIKTDMYIVNNLSVKNVEHMQHIRITLSDSAVRTLKEVHDIYKGVLSVYIFSENQAGKQAIPIKNILLEKRVKRSVNFSLPPGKYVYKVLTRYGLLLDEGVLDIM